MAKKTTAYLCPECGEDIDIETTDTEIDESSLSCKMYCAVCGASWHEYFELRYDGYAYKGVDYEADGEEMFEPIKEDKQECEITANSPLPTVSGIMVRILI